MAPDLTETLKNKYSSIFGPTFYFECNDGWFTLIDNTCKVIQQHLKYSTGVEQVIARQVKEKFGGLRFYYSGGNDYILGVVDLAEQMSYNICEISGLPGSMHVNLGHFKTLSDEEAKKAGFTKFYSDMLP